MVHSPDQLASFTPGRDFFIGIDSDGCAFDSMEIKQKECFCPNFIRHFSLQAVSRYAREVWEFVNLYSVTRGCNRFLALIDALDFLSARKEAVARNIQIPRLENLRDWISRESKLGNPALIAEVEKTGDTELDMVLQWSLDVNHSIEQMVTNLPPFPLVRETLEKAGEQADMIVVSQTPFEALDREWKEHGLNTFIHMIAGQEMGTKTEHIRYAAGQKYKADHILMIGDAPGDFKAAKDNNALFFPINPGQEEKSWEQLYSESLERFFSGTYAGTYENELIKKFNACLPEKPSW